VRAFSRFFAAVRSLMRACRAKCNSFSSLSFWLGIGRSWRSSASPCAPARRRRPVPFSQRNLAAPRRTALPRRSPLSHRTGCGGGRNRSGEGFREGAAMAGSLALLGAIIAAVTPSSVPGDVLPSSQTPMADATEPAAPLFFRYGCGGCIPGIPGASGRAGPSLAEFSERLYIAGALRNERTNLIRWIVDPRAIQPRTAMPETGISEAEAASLAGYLLRSD
jgi:cytochrome c